MKIYSVIEDNIFTYPDFAIRSGVLVLLCKLVRVSFCSRSQQSKPCMHEGNRFFFYLRVK
jgi:hypothetical protein